MLKLLFKNKKLWMPALIIMFLIILMVVLSQYGFNPLGYVVY
jgi:hypothetical protein